MVGSDDPPASSSNPTSVSTSRRKLWSENHGRHQRVTAKEAFNHKSTFHWWGSHFTSSLIMLYQLDCLSVKESQLLRFHQSGAAVWLGYYPSTEKTLEILLHVINCDQLWSTVINCDQLSAVLNFSINNPPKLQFSRLCIQPIKVSLTLSQCKVNGQKLTVLFQSFRRRRCWQGGGGGWSRCRCYHSGRSASGWASADWLRPIRGGVLKPGVSPPVHNDTTGMVHNDTTKAPSLVKLTFLVYHILQHAQSNVWPCDTRRRTTRCPICIISLDLPRLWVRNGTQRNNIFTTPCTLMDQAMIKPQVDQQ